MSPHMGQDALMDEIKQLRDKLRKYGRRNWPKLALASGVPVKTITKIAYGEIRVPGADKYLLLLRHMEE